MMNPHYHDDGYLDGHRHRFAGDDPGMSRYSNGYNEESVSEVSPSLQPSHYSYQDLQQHSVSSLHGRYVRSSMTPSWSTASRSRDGHPHNHNKPRRVVVDLTRVRDKPSSQSSTTCSSSYPSEEHMSHFYHHPQAQECMVLLSAHQSNAMMQPITRAEREFVPHQYLNDGVIPEPDFYQNHILNVVEEEESLYDATQQNHYGDNYYFTNEQQLYDDYPVFNQHYHEDVYDPNQIPMVEDTPYENNMIVDRGENWDRPMLYDPMSLDHPNHRFWTSPPSRDAYDHVQDTTRIIDSQSIDDMITTTRSPGGAYEVNHDHQDEDILSFGTLPKILKQEKKGSIPLEEDANRFAKLPPPLKTPIPPPPKNKSEYEVDCTDWSRHGGLSGSSSVPSSSSTTSSSSYSSGSSLAESEDSSFVASVISFAASIIDRREWMGDLVHNLVTTSNENIKSIFSNIAAQHKNRAINSKADAKKTMSLIKEYRTSKRYCHHVLEHMDVSSILENIDIGLYDNTVEKYRSDVEKAIDRSMMVFQQLEEDGLKRQLEFEAAQAKKSSKKAVMFAATKVTKDMIQRKHQHLREHVGNELKKHFTTELKMKWLDHQCSHLGKASKHHVVLNGQ